MKCSRFSHRRRNVFASAAGWAPVVDELQNDLLVTDDACTSTSLKVAPIVYQQLS
jgi:hypothetical protein